MNHEPTAVQAALVLLYTTTLEAHADELLHYPDVTSRSAAIIPIPVLELVRLLAGDRDAEQVRISASRLLKRVDKTKD